MSTYSDRLASFTDWPLASPTPEDLAKAGLSYGPTRANPDNVICKTCDHCICDWEPDDDPELELHIHHLRCSMLWIPTSQKKLSIKDIGFFDPSLQHDFPELCLFQNVHVYCDRMKRLTFFETDILDLLPSCLRGDALRWFNQSDYQDLAVCLGAMRARFWRQAPPEGPLTAPQAPPGAPLEAPPRAPDYHHCKLCNASFSSIARLMRHAQENICDKPSCRHCEKVFSSKNQLHRHLREDCQKQRHRRPSPSPSPPYSPTWLSACSSICSPTSSPAPSPAPSPPPAYRAISPSPPNYLTIKDLSTRFAKPPYLKVDDLFRMFGGSSATTTTTESSIILASDDPFARPFVFLPKKSLESTQKRDWGMATSHHQIARAQCSTPRSVCERCRQPLLSQHRQEATRPKMV